MSYTTDSLVANISVFALEYLRLWNPRVVLLAGDVAFEKIAVAYQLMREANTSLPSIPFLFCDVYQDLSNSNHSRFLATSTKSGPISGIEIDQPYQKKIDLALKLNPNSVAISFIFDQMLSSKYQMNNLKEWIDKSALSSNNLTIHLHNLSLFDEFKEKINFLKQSNHSIIVMNAQKLYTNQHKNVTVLPHIISQWVLANVGVNVLGPLDLGFAIDVKIKKKKIIFKL